jgi:Tol biopolymer transport system component
MRWSGEGLRPSSGPGRLIVGVGVLAVALGGWASAAGADGPFITRASVSSAEAPADFDTPSFTEPSISADGRYIAFDSFAENLVPGTEGGVFVRDTLGGTTSAASIRANGTVDDFAESPAISADGRFVAFLSDDPLLVPGGNDNFVQVFLRDRTTGVTTRVSTKMNGFQATDENDNPSISNDGRYIAFESDSPGLVPGDTNDWTDVFVRDRVTNTTKRVDLMSNGAQSDFGGENPSISGNGRYVAFSSSEPLVPADTNGVGDIYVRDVVANTTTLVSIAASGARGNSVSSEPRISGNGKFVVFSSLATNMDGIVDNNSSPDLFVRDLVAKTTQRVSRSAAGGLAHGVPTVPSISSNGRFVAYESTAADAVAGDTNNVADAFVYDRTLNTTRRISTNEAGGQLALGGTMPAISADGRIVAFASAAPIPGLPASTGRQLYTRLNVPALTAEAPPEVSIGNAAVVEGNLRSRQLRFTVTLSRPSTSAATVWFATAPGTAAAGTDFVAKGGILTIPAGRTSGVIAIDVKGDRAAEAHETFTVKLVTPGGARLGRTTGTGTILNDDNPTNPAVRLSIGNAALVEGHTGQRALRFTVSLSASSPTPVTFHYATANKTASGADYVQTTGTATIPARATSTVVNIMVKGDFNLEANELFTVKLSQPTGATIHRATGTGTILDDG